MVKHTDFISISSPIMEVAFGRPPVWKPPWVITCVSNIFVFISCLGLIVSLARGARGFINQ